MHVTRLLLTHKTNPNGTVDEETPLQIACYKGDVSLVELLLEYKADPTLASKPIDDH